MKHHWFHAGVGVLLVLQTVKDWHIYAIVIYSYNAIVIILCNSY